MGTSLPNPGTLNWGLFKEAETSCSSEAILAFEIFLPIFIPPAYSVSLPLLPVLV